MHRSRHRKGVDMRAFRPWKGAHQLFGLEQDVDRVGDPLAVRQQTKLGFRGGAYLPKKCDGLGDPEWGHEVAAWLRILDQVFHQTGPWGCVDPLRKSKAKAYAILARANSRGLDDDGFRRAFEGVAAPLHSERNEHSGRPAFGSEQVHACCANVLDAPWRRRSRGLGERDEA